MKREELHEVRCVICNAKAWVKVVREIHFCSLPHRFEYFFQNKKKDPEKPIPHTVTLGGFSPEGV